MSYCRFSDADIYVFAGRDGFECCACPTAKTDDGKLVTGPSFVTDNAGAMLRHMKDHRTAGFDVPDYAFGGIFEDRGEYRTSQWSTWSPDSIHPPIEKIEPAATPQ